jgi:hypothetical protein
MKSLHKLIHKLNPTEKRYIKMRLNVNKSDSELSQYFEVFVEEENYDIAKLELIFNKPSKLLRANFGKLYATILKNLRLYHHKSSAEYEMHGTLADVELLLNKGMVEEAQKSNEKLIELAKEKESFYVLVKAYSYGWTIYHLSGNLTAKNAHLLQKRMNDYISRHFEIELITDIHRKALVFYNEYFFIKRNENTKLKISTLVDHPLLADIHALSTDQSRMLFYEIWSIHHSIHQKVEEHYETRRQQFELVFHSKVYVDDYVNKVLILGNLCSFFVYKNDMRSLKKYFSFFQKHFSLVIENSSDSVFIEKYYDVYLQCKIHLTKFNGKKDAADLMYKEALPILTEKIQINSNLIGRTYWALAELFILHDQPKEALKLIIHFQDIYKSNRSSNYFLESEIGLIIVYHVLKKDDEFDKKIEYVQRKAKEKKYILAQDHKVIMEVFRYISKNYQKDTKKLLEYSNKIKLNTLYKAFVNSLVSGKSLNESQ